VLHFAPEWSLERWLRAQPELDYQTSDLNGPADLQLDITAIALPDESVDVVIASHVLEHVEAERSALREVRRILRPGGRAIVLVPIDHDRTATYEDPAIVTPHERERAYRQHDHVRLYGRDVVSRLSAEGLRFSADRYAHELGPEARRRYGLLEVDEIYVGVR
jgi:predicted SAM-dependent methyltransferase